MGGIRHVDHPQTLVPGRHPGQTARDRQRKGVRGQGDRPPDGQRVGVAGGHDRQPVVVVHDVGEIAARAGGGRTAPQTQPIQLRNRRPRRDVEHIDAVPIYASQRIAVREADRLARVPGRDGADHRDGRRIAHVNDRDMAASHTGNAAVNLDIVAVLRQRDVGQERGRQGLREVVDLGTGRLAQDIEQTVRDLDVGREARDRPLADEDRRIRHRAIDDTQLAIET